MNPLRALGDLIAGNPRRPAPYIHPLDDEAAVGLPDWAERRQLMRRDGEDCHNPDHADALRRLGRAVADRDEAEASADYWCTRALRAEEKLRHPSSGQAA